MVLRAFYWFLNMLLRPDPDPYLDIINITTTKDNKMTPYEKKVRQEIEGWKSQKDGLVTKALNVAGKPIDWVYEKVLPGSVQKTVGKAVSGFIEMLKDAAQWTFPDKNIVKEARKIGIEIDDHRQLRDYDIEKLDQIAKTIF